MGKGNGDGSKGKPVYVSAQWIERDKAKLDKLLARWHNSGDTMAPMVKQDDENGMGSKLAELLEAEFSNGDFISFTTTHDLDLVRLSEDKTAEDVLKLFGER